MGIRPLVSNILCRSYIKLPHHSPSVLKEGVELKKPVKKSTREEKGRMILQSAKILFLNFKNLPPLLAPNTFSPPLPKVFPLNLPDAIFLPTSEV